MKERPSVKLTICRLLTLLLIVLVGLGSAANQVNGAVIRHGTQSNKFDFSALVNDMKINPNIEKADTTGSTQIRKHLLENVCSKKIVKVFHKGPRQRVNANGKMRRTLKEMPFSQLTFESMPWGTLRIYGSLTGLYICFNKRGRLVAKETAKPNNGCDFIEEYSEDLNHTLYKSSKQPWYIGFRRNGKPYNYKKNKTRKGRLSSSKSVNRECFKFRKITPRKTSVPKCTPPAGSGPEGFDYCDIKLWEKFLPQNTRRHSKSHKKHRRNG